MPPPRARALLWPMAALLALLGQETVKAQGASGAAPGDFESWVMALEWQPTWIEGHCGDPELAEHFLPESYAASHLSVHGLWPNYDPALHTGHAWPEYCTASDGLRYDRCQAEDFQLEQCHPSEAVLEEFNVTQRWMRYAVEYSWTDLASHEWSKHGSCTGYSQDYYFGLVEEMQAMVAETSAAALLTHLVGGEVAYADLRDAFVSSFGAAPALRCKTCELSDIYFAYAAEEDTLLPAEIMDNSEEDSCGHCAMVKVPSFSGCDVPPSPDACTRGARGPECVYDAATAGTAADACTQHRSCLRCARSQHSGKHYCTMEPLVATIKRK